MQQLSNATSSTNRLLLRVSFAVLFLLSSAASAFADATLFIGSTTTPANRTAKGVAVGFGLVIIGFEFEYRVRARSWMRQRVP